MGSARKQVLWLRVLLLVDMAHAGCLGYVVWEVLSTGLGVLGIRHLLRAILFANHKANGAVTNIGLSS